MAMSLQVKNAHRLAQVCAPSVLRTPPPNPTALSSDLGEEDFKGMIMGAGKGGKLQF
jgi:hypothetical protein